MKCVKCSTDNKLKDRTANRGHCKTCRHPITFDPKAAAGLDFTDRFFAGAISATSVNDTLFFTPRQFHYSFNARRQKAKDPLGKMGCLILALGIIFIIIALSWRSPILALGALLVLAAGVLLLIPKVRKRLRAKQPKEITVTSDQLEKLILIWAHNNGRVAKLLPTPQAAPMQAHISPEIKQYSFDRLVVCEHATIAQFLIANNFHFENNCAVLSIDKYPNEIFDTVMEMLRRNPALKVYALHDASPAGIQLTHRLTTESDWFQGSSNVQIYDLGLLPRQILDRSVFVRESSASASQAAKVLASPAFASLRPEEVKWLREGKYVELESISPKMLLRVVTQGIARSRVPGAEDALVPLSSRRDYDTAVYIFAYDSFG